MKTHGCVYRLRRRVITYDLERCELRGRSLFFLNEGTSDVLIDQVIRIPAKGNFSLIGSDTCDVQFENKVEFLVSEAEQPGGGGTNSFTIATDQKNRLVISYLEQTDL